MSLQFSDTTNYKGIVQSFEKEIGANIGDISGNTIALKSLCADVNSALDDYVEMAIKASGTWQFDDSNQSDYPIIYTNLVSGQRDYSFTVDGSGNLILDIYRVFIQDTTGKYIEIFPKDAQSEKDTTNFTDGQNTGGVPGYYDKTANGIFLDLVPNYNATGGLKIYINREATYFSYTDTTKKPGVPGLHHRYFVIKPAYEYAARNGMAIAGGRLRNGAFTGLLYQVTDMEDRVSDYFRDREKDVRKAIAPFVEDCQ